jgi:tetratricopeptide (TPR) repeat protein
MEAVALGLISKLGGVMGKTIAGQAAAWLWNRLRRDDWSRRLAENATQGTDLRWAKRRLTRWLRRPGVRGRIEGDVTVQDIALEIRQALLPGRFGFVHSDRYVEPALEATSILLAEKVTARLLAALPEAIQVSHDRMMPLIQEIAENTRPEQDVEMLFNSLPPLLPPKARQLLKENRTSTLRLVAALVTTVTPRDDTLDQLLAEPMPQWIEEMPASVWAFLGDYASTYNRPALAAALYRRAAAAGVPLRAHLLVRAATCEKALKRDFRQTLDEAAALPGQPDLYLRIARAFLQDEWEECIAACNSTSDLLVDDLLVPYYRAAAYSQLQQIESAIDAVQPALDAMPQSSSTALLMARLLLARGTRGDGLLRDHDLRTAYELATRARDLRRVWMGPSGECLEVMLDAQILRGNRDAVFELGLPEPEGSASVAEAQYLGVLEAVGLIAVDRERWQLAEHAVAKLPQDSTSRLVVEGAMLVRKGQEQTGRGHLLRAYETATDDLQKIKALRALATAGLFPFPDASDLLASSEDEPHYLEALALSKEGRLEQAVVLLAPLTARLRGAAELLAEVYETMGRYDDAVAVLDRAAAQYADPDLEAQAAFVLADVGRDADAKERGSLALMRLFPTSALQRKLRRMLMAVSWRLRLFDDVIAHARAYLSDSAHDIDAQWFLAAAQAASRRHAAALETMKRYHLTPRSELEAFAWLDCASQQLPLIEWLPTALELAKEYPEGTGFHRLFNERSDGYLRSG